MINKLSIQNYKSVKQLDIDCKKVNVFIGEPNTGKSNILEALSFFSPEGTFKDTMQEILRFKTLGDLFFDFNYNNPITVVTNNLAFELAYRSADFVGTFSDSTESKKKRLQAIKFNPDGSRNGISVGTVTSMFRSYYFKRLKSFNAKFQNYLSPPFGDNIPVLLDGNPELYEMIDDIFRSKGFRILNKRFEDDINIVKETDGKLYSYPYYAISETLQRIVFMTLAMESNKHCTLIFDEPESNTFPFYTKYIAERMALDETNQYFITTHNPYLLMSIIEKTPIVDLNVFVARMENYETKVLPLGPDKLEQALDFGSDVFFNLELLTSQ